MAPRILYVDNITPLNWLVNQFLSGASFAVTSVDDPEGALDRARREVPDAIVLDPSFADHEGWEVLASLQSDAELSQVPTVIYTALPETTIADHAARCLYDDLRYVSKDEDLDSLLDRLAEATGAPSLAEYWSA
ncbi:MAG TPA: response regulator [Dehalococcoidia bacterium]|nr:response regulator [Dehalococcoidia bacterium]